MGVLAAVALASAWSLSPVSLENQSAYTMGLQLDEARQAIRPEYAGYMAASWMYLPLPSQSPLETRWGTHDGYAFRQRLSAWLSNPLDSSAWRVGLVWWGERQGFDQEDFLIFPAYGRFGRVQSVHTGGMSLGDSSRHWNVAGGIQYRNVEYLGEEQGPSHDYMGWWQQAQWRFVGVQSSWHKGTWQSARLNLDMQARSVRGGADSGWTTYLPDLGVQARNWGDSLYLRYTWEQNLYGQLVYAAGALGGAPENPGWEWVALRLYPDPSRLVSLEGTLSHRDGRTWWGGGLNLPFVRVAYNHAEDYDAFFKSRGVWLLELRLGIGSAGSSFFGLGGARRTETISAHENAPGNRERGEVEKAHVTGGKP